MAEDLRKQVKRLEIKLIKIGKNEVPKAASSALNSVAKKSRTRIASVVAKSKKIKVGLVRKKIFIRRSNPKSQRALITAYAQDIPAVSVLTSRTLLAKARRGTNRKGVRVAGKQIDGAFINVVRRSGRFHVLKRSGKSRYPIDVVKIPIANTVKRHSSKIVRAVHSRDFRRIYARELNFRLNKYAK